jgi:hypothetical protein
VYLRNDQEVLQQLDRKDGWLKQIARTKCTPDELIRQAYLRALNRLPEEQESSVASRYLRESQDTIGGLRDLLWALLNTKEFMVNR